MITEQQLKDFEIDAKIHCNKSTLILVDEIKRLREVIKFYADINIYHHQSVMYDKTTSKYTEYDRGQKACAALGID